jgi:hypothetical protein
MEIKSISSGAAIESAGPRVLLGRASFWYRQAIQSPELERQYPHRWKRAGLRLRSPEVPT